MEIIFLGIFIFAYKFFRTKNNVFLKSLFLLYLITFVFAYILSFSINDIISVRSFLFLITILLLWILPFKNLNNDLFLNLKSNRYELSLFTKIFNIVLTPATFYFAYWALKMLLTQDISTVRVTGIATGALSLLPRTIITTIFSSVATLYFIPLFLFFFYLKEGGKTITILFSFVSSLSFPLLTLCYAGRDGIVYWIINFIILYLLFRNQLKKRVSQVMINSLRIASLFLVVLFVYLFVKITFFRFSTIFDPNASLFSVINYLGQQPFNFSNIYDEFEFLTETNPSLFPGFRKILFGIEPDVDTLEIYKINNLLSEYNVFGYFVKTLYLGYGKIFAIIISILFLLIAKRIIKSFINNRDIYTFFIIFVLFQIPMNGVFYYRQGIGMGDVIFTLFIILCFYLQKKNYVVQI